MTIPSGTAKETADHEFIAASAANLSLNVSNASNANATTEGAPHNQSQDGQKSDTAQHSTSHDNEAFERMYTPKNVNFLAKNLRIKFSVFP